jgi:putative oxidoreductase
MLMLSAPQRDLVRDKGTKAGRMLIGLLFFASGLSMLLVDGPSATAMYFETLGIPLAGLVVWIVIGVKVLAGLAIILGYRVGLAAAALIGFTLAATIAAHRDFADPNLFKNLAIVGGLLYLMAYGPGGSNTTELSAK